jgi:hypothetical protein
MSMRITGAKILAAVAVAIAAVTAPADAALITFTGADDGAGSLATAPNSVGAAASFDAAIAALGNKINSMAIQNLRPPSSARYP